MICFVGVLSPGVGKTLSAAGANDSETAASSPSPPSSRLSAARASAFAAARATARVQVSFFARSAEAKASPMTRSSSATSRSASTADSGAGACFANAPRNAPSSACACVKSHAAAALAARSEARLGSNSAETSAATFRVGVSGSASPKVYTFAAADHRNRRAETSAAASRNEAACSDTRCAAAAASGFSASGSAAAVPNEPARATSASDGLSDHLATQSARASASARLAASNGNQTVARSTMRPRPGGPACTTNARAKCASTTSRMNPWSRRSVSGAKNRHRHASRAPRASSSDGQTVPSFCFRVIPNPRPGPSSRRNLARSSAQLSRASSAMKAGSPNRANAPAPGTPRRTL